MNFLKTLKDTVLQSLPLVIFIAAVIIFIKPLPVNSLLTLIGGYAFVMLGQTLFLLGIENSILPMGKLVGDNIAKLKKVVFIIIFGFLFGLITSVAEPSLSVIVEQFTNINSTVVGTLIVWIVSAGVGVGVGFGLFKVIKAVSIKWLLLFFMQL
jgi:hypothetical protein